MRRGKKYTVRRYRNGAIGGDQLSRWRDQMNLANRPSPFLLLPLVLSLHAFIPGLNNIAFW